LGLIATPKDLEEVDAVVISGGMPDWSFERGRKRVAVRPRARLVTSSYAMAREAALDGIGIVRLPSYYLAADLKSAKLTTVLDDWTPREVTISAVYPSRELVPLKTRAFVDLLVKRVAKRPLLEV
jgi:DNA-binding transcriptional LysR family regulator